MNTATSKIQRSRAILTVFLKEVKENLRDRRTLMSAFLTGPLLGPLLFVMLINLTLSRELDKAEKPLSVPVIGAEFAPNLLVALTRIIYELNCVVEAVKQNINLTKLAHQ